MLLFTCLGYADVRETIGGRSRINVELSESATQLDELVVIGYGTVKKSDLTGAVSSVKGDELKKAAVASVGAALQGKVAGVTVTSNTGQPGSDVSIRIRGIGSVNAGVSPLYVVDGMIVNDINFLSPNDIATTEVLKDAASAAIYGSRAANGVILITTKSASNNEKASVTFEAYAGVQTRWRKLDLMQSQEHLETMFKINGASQAELEAYQTGGLNGWLNYARIGGVADFPVATDVPGQGFNYAAQNTDWQDEVFRNAAIQNYYLSVDSGSRKVSQTFSANYFSQDGTVIGSWYNRLNLHYNASSQIKKWLKIGSSLNFSSTKSRWSLNNNSQPGASVISAALAMAPWDPAYYPEGSLNYLGEDLGGQIAAASNFKNVVNPYSMATHDFPRGSTERFVGNIYLDLNIVKGLVFHSDFNFDLSFVHSRSFTEAYYHSNADKRDENMISQNMSRSKSLNFNNYLTYNKDIGKHSFSVMAGQTIDISENEGVGVGGSNLLHTDERFWSLAYATSDFTYGGSYYGPYRRMSFIGRVTYDYGNRYLLTFNWRSDGNRSFQNHPWGHFPSVAVAWKLNEENWLKSSDKVSLLKLRFGWGLLGNDSVDSNLFTMTMESSQYANLGYPFVAALEFGLHHAGGGSGRYHGRVRPGACEERQCAEQYGLSSAGLSRNNDKTLREIDIQRVYQDIVPYMQGQQHGLRLFLAAGHAVLLRETVVELSVLEFGNGHQVGLGLALVILGYFYLLLVLENFVHGVAVASELLELLGELLLLGQGYLVGPLGKYHDSFIDVARRGREVSDIPRDCVGRYLLFHTFCTAGTVYKVSFFSLAVS